MTTLQHKLSSEDRASTPDPETLEDLDPQSAASETEGSKGIANWDAAEQALRRTAEADLIQDNEVILFRLAWLCALRGDTEGMDGLFGQMSVYPTSKAPQDQASLSVARGLSAAQPVVGPMH